MIPHSKPLKAEVTETDKNDTRTRSHQSVTGAQQSERVPHEVNLSPRKRCRPDRPSMELWASAGKGTQQPFSRLRWLRLASKA